MTGAALCISIDLELAWGIWDRPSATYHRLCAEKERAIVAALLASFARHEAPVTWAIVGRLLARGPTPGPAGPHGDRIWYAPDLIEAIQRAAPRHDIGSHGFEHVYFGELTADRARADLEAARQVHARHGLDFASFVFPRNSIAHLDALRASTVRVYRSLDHGWHITVRERAGRLAGRGANLVDKLVPVPPAVVRPTRRDDGLVDLPGSMLLLARNGLRRLVHPRLALEKARQGLRAARREGGVFHLWFHPSNFYFDTERQLALVDQIVGEAAAMRRRGELAITPMSGFAAA